MQAWDWDFYADFVRKAKYDLNDAEIKPYFEINNVLENGVFFAANQLYGITFKERKDIPVYEPDVRVFEVSDVDGKPLALFYCDYFKRDNKQGGAWMSEFVGQSKLLGTLPVVYNVANLPKPAPGEPALISFDDVTTMFHEFGHALHGMFSDTRYPTLAGTSTARDFVEFPSQFNEHWAIYPTVFAHYAKHYQTGRPMPDALVAKIKKSEKFRRRVFADRNIGSRRTRHAMACTNCGCAFARSGCVRKAGAGKNAFEPGRGAAALSIQLLQPHLGQRLLGRLLRLSLDTDAGR